ncbi:4-hydroxythreonine-4-phosphate dehydrogenase 2 [Terrihabitans soli]|uniref:4-hydroxythreonine-4-phosphate dehydrogenase n=1 Tax=Terrihabitans soli TaxID=708113 RepID=A0A6S6QI05_9HYPH|nr:4-hydroxythreonine-4-phosphate dehydrogenase PdxA [Terrihabitans soli]BCJ90853.1 4-hydroxythreonine-4-phosphate dehydrogenase 2 [Terrihabitans soli]
MNPLALTMGEPAGIGPELALLAWMRRTAFDLPPFFVLADPDHLAHLAKNLDYAVPIVVTEPERAAEMFPLALPVAPLDMAVVAEPGTPNAADAPAVIESIRRGVSLVQTGRASALVTNPISKAPLMRAGFPHPGHTEFLGALAQEHAGEKFRPVMMLWAPELAVVPVTVHIPLHEVPARLTRDLIVETARITAHDLKTRFGIPHPRLALAGLNPHAGEDGALGTEDAKIIAPAIADLRAEGIMASGPYPADTLFHPAARKTYDAALAMYHDQALIPIKTIAFDRAVNVTLGLPFVRTSPDHGTAFDIAGKGEADASSLIAAIKLAERLSAA